VQGALAWRRTFGGRVFQFAVIVIQARSVAQKLQFLIGAIGRVRVQYALRRITGLIELIPLAATEPALGRNTVLFFAATSTRRKELQLVWGYI
jgi:hypothetical protein